MILRILKSLLDMIAMGEYGFVGYEITEENFPKVGDVEYKEYRLFFFDRIVRYEEVIAEMARYGFVPATLADLCAFGVISKVQEFPVVAIGQYCWNDAEGAKWSCIRTHNNMRTLETLKARPTLGKKHHFLAVRNVSS